MSGYAVDLELLTELVSRMAAFERGLEGVRDDVESRMNRVRGVWTGVAAQEHVAAHTRWETGLAETHEALRTLHAIASRAHRNYQAAIRTNATMWSG